MPKLYKLTSEQIELLEALRDEWINRALYESDDLDDEKARKSLEWLYALAGKKKPITILLDSPLALQYAANMLKSDQVSGQVRGQVWSQVRGQVLDQVSDQVLNQVRDQVRDQVSDQVSGQVRGQVWSQVRDQVSDQVRDQVRDQVWSQVSDQVWNQVRGQVWSQVRGQVLDQVSDQVSDQVRDQVWNQVRDQVRGQKLESFYFGYEDLSYASGWVAFYEYFEKLGIVNHKAFKEYKKLLKSGIFMTILLEDIVLACRKPNFVSRNTEHSLDNDHRSAISWRDGYKLFYLQGECFDKELWTKIISQTLTIKEALQIEDVDKRVIAQSMLPPGDLLKHLKAKLINTGSEGTKLYECKDFMETSKTEYCMTMKDWSTPRNFLEFVPPEVGKIGSAVHAQAAAFGISDDQYLAIKERG